jgi:hypothetical protein
VITEKKLSEKQLDVLHDHYKETFARMREAEALRDRLFLWVIGLFALLSLEIGYPAAVGGVLGTLSIAGGELQLQALPLPALLNATWVLTLTIGLRYCQTAVFVNRQYPYLHGLEEAISPAVGGGDLYHREGKVYLSEYPLLLNLAWISYGIVFPLIVMGATIGLLIWEVTKLPYPIYHIYFDVFVGGALIFFYFFYRVEPTISSLGRRLQAWWRNRRTRAKGTSPHNKSAKTRKL